MNVLGLQVFVSLMLVLGSVVALLYSVRQGDHEHSDRLSLLPLEEDDGKKTPAAPAIAGRLPEVRKTSTNEGD
jgi:hypothetical protein